MTRRQDRMLRTGHPEQRRHFTALRPAATLRELPFDDWCRTEEPGDALDATIFRELKKVFPASHFCLVGPQVEPGCTHGCVVRLGCTTVKACSRVSAAQCCDRITERRPAHSA